MRKASFFIIILAVSLFVVAAPASAQTSTESGTSTSSGTTTLPETGIDDPLFIMLGAGVILFGSGLLFKKLQSQTL